METSDLSFKAVLLSKPGPCSHLHRETCKTSFRDDIVDCFSKPAERTAPSANPNVDQEL